MAETNWSRCRELLAGKDPSPARVALVCEEISKCQGRPVQEIVEADPCSPLVVALLGYYLVQSADDVGSSERAVTAAEIAVEVLVNQILSGANQELNQYQQIRILVGLCVAANDPTPCLALSASEIMAASAVLRMAGDVSGPGSAQSGQEVSRHDESEVDSKADDDMYLVGDADENDEDDEDEDEDNDSSSLEDLSETTEGGKRTPQSVSSEVIPPPLPAEEKSKTPPAKDNLDRRNCSARAAFLLRGLGSDKFAELVTETPPALPPKPPDLRQQCCALLQRLGAVKTLMDKGMAAPALQTCTGNATDLTPTLLSTCQHDVQFLYHVLALVGVVPLESGTGDQLRRCSELLTRCVQCVLQHSHAKYCRPSSRESGDADRGDSNSSASIDAGNLPQFLSRSMQAYTCLDAALEKHKSDPLYDKNLGVAIYMKRTCDLLSAAGQQAMCKQVATDPFKCALVCTFADVFLEPLLQSLPKVWSDWASCGPLPADVSIADAPEYSESGASLTPCAMAVTQGKLLHSILFLLTGNFHKAARITNLLTPCEPFTGGRRRRSNAISIASPRSGLHARKAAARSEDEKLFLDELMLSMPDDEAETPDQDHARDVVCEMLDTCKLVMEALVAILSSPNPEHISVIRANLGTWQLLSLGDMLSEMEILGMLSEQEAYENHEQLRFKYHKFATDLVALLHLLVLRDFLVQEQQIALLASLGFSVLEGGTWALRGSAERVSVIAHILICDQESDGSLCQKALDRFVASLRHEIVDSATQAPLGATDVSVAHFQLMLTLFHGFPLEKRQEIFADLVKLLIQASRQLNVHEQPPLILMRVLQFVDYLVYHFQYPPMDLAERVRFNLFNPSGFQSPRFISTADGAQVSYDQDKNIDVGDARPHLRSLIDMEPRFYDLRHSGSSGQSEPDPEAVAFLRSLSGEDCTYANFYSSLITLLGAGGLCGISTSVEQLPSYENHVPLASTCVRSALRHTWHLLHALPTPCSLLQDVGDAAILGDLDVSDSSTASPKLLQYLSRLIFTTWVAIRLRSLDKDEKRQDFAKLAQEHSGQFADADICLSIVVAAQEEVGETDWMKAVELAVNGFEGCCDLLGQLDKEQIPSPLLLLAADLCMWQTRGCLDRWFDSAAASEDGLDRDELPAARAVAQKVAALASRALPALVAFSRTAVLVMGQRSGEFPPPPLPRGGKAGSSLTPAAPSAQPSSSLFTPQQEASAAEPSAAAASSPSTPTNPVEPPAADASAQRGLSLSAILAQARNLTGALSGMASAIEALSNPTSAASLSSSAMDILDELDTFRAAIAATECAVSARPEREEAETPAAPARSQPCSPEHIALYQQALQLGTITLNGKGASSINRPLVPALPSWLQHSLSSFKAVTLVKYPSLLANGDPQSLKHLHDLASAHMTTLTGCTRHFNVCAALKHTVESLLSLCSHVLGWCAEKDEIHPMLVNAVVPCLFDATCLTVTSKALALLDTCLGTPSSDAFKNHVLQFIVSAYFDAIMVQKDPGACPDDRVAAAMLQVPTAMLENPAQRLYVENYFKDEGHLVAFLMLSSLPHIDGAFTCLILSFFRKYCAHLSKDISPTGQSVQLSALAKFDGGKLTDWIRRVFITLKTDDWNRPRDSFNEFILELVASRAVDVATYKALLAALLPIGEELLADNLNISFSLFVHCASSLADACGADGHISLCTATTKWLATGETILLGQMKEGDELSVLDHPMLDSITQLLRYLSNLSAAIKVASGRGQSDVPLDSEPPLQEVDGDWGDEMQDEDESEEESDDEALLSKLCTFTTTQHEYARQHWYHCYTCNFTNNTGVCTICARVCHKGHDLAYAKMGAFFCDCGAKSETCKALTKRSSASAGGDADSSKSSQSAFDAGESPSESKSRSAAGHSRSAAPVPAPSQLAHQAGGPTPRVLTMATVIEPCKDQLVELMNSQGTAQTVLHLVQTLLPWCVAQGRSILSQHGHALAHQAVGQLHCHDKKVETDDQLVIGTAGSTEGLFDNVRVQLNGEQGNLIRQQLASSTIKRSAMCTVVSTRNKKQHVAVNPEKGKITILQVSALLRQFDSHRRKYPGSGEPSSQSESKRRKVTTRMTSTSVPFTILSMTSNPVNDEYVAVCGHKDLHVLAFSPSGSGSVSQHITLHPTLEGSNCIIKALWLPGSQTQLAVITTDFIKVWDLGVDSVSPSYNFLLPSGKIMDATAMETPPGSLQFVVMSTTGIVCMQPVEEACSAKYGPFYMTNALAVEYKDLQTNKGVVAGGGASVYYSHCLQLLFFSFLAGKTFACRLTEDGSNISKLFPIPIKSSGKVAGLYQWLEVAGHPGLVCALSTNVNTPVVMMVEPKRIVVCETKALPSKSKVQGIVGMRHNPSGAEYRTALVVLCEDGALRLFGVDPAHSGYWAQPAFHPSSPLTSLQPARQLKPPKVARSSGSSGQPVDFFENLTHMNEVEFGGNDILQIYTSQQTKHRLSVTGQYLASTKSNGFTVEVTNTSSTMAMCGCRIHLGGQYGSDRTTPISFSVMDRPAVHIAPTTRLRWFDITFTREEAVQYQKKFSITVGASPDPNGVTIVHSIRIYGKSKDALGFGDEGHDDGHSASLLPSDGDVLGDQQPGCMSSTPSCVPITTASRFLASCLEVLESYFATVQSLASKENMLGVALSTATALLVAPMPQSVTTQTQCLLAALHPTRQAFHVHKDQAQLGHVARCLQSVASPEKTAERAAEAINLEVSTFEHLLAVARTVAVARPTNLFQFAHSPACHRALGLLGPGQDHVTDSSGGHPGVDGEAEEPILLRVLMRAFWDLLEIQPINRNVVPVWYSGMRNVESVVMALVQILLSFVSSDSSLAPCVVKHLVDLLLCENSSVGFGCRRAIVVALNPTVKRKHSTAVAGDSAGERASSGTTSGLLESVLRRQASSHTPPPADDVATGGGSSAGAGAPPSSLGRGRTHGHGRRGRGAGRGRFAFGDGGDVPAPNADSGMQGILAGALPAELQGLSAAEAASIIGLLEDEASDLMASRGGSAGTVAGGSAAAQLEALLGGGDLMPEDLNTLANMVAEDDSMVEMALALTLQEGSSDSASGGSGGSRGAGAYPPLSATSRSLLQQAMQSGNLSQLAQLAGMDVQSLQAIAQSSGVGQHALAGAGAGSDMMLMEAGSHASQDVEVGSLGSTAALHQLVSDHGSSHAEVASTGADLVSLPESAQDQDVASSDDDEVDNDDAVGERRGSNTSSLGSLNDVVAPNVSSQEAPASVVGETSEVESMDGDISANVSQRATPAPSQASETPVSQAATSALCSKVDEDEDPAARVLTKAMHSLSLQLLHHLLKHVSLLDSVGGLRAIPYLQTLLLLCARLDDNMCEENRPALVELLETCIGQLAMTDENMDGVSERTPRHEVKLVLLRLLSVLMSRTRPQGKSSLSSGTMVCNVTAQTLVAHSTLDFCLLVLKGLLNHWMTQPANKDEQRSASAGAAATSGTLLQGHLSSAVPDMSPFFLKGYVKGHARDVFECFPQLLTEIVLRLAYLIKKILDPDCKNMELFSEEWATCLAEYLLAPQQVACVRKQVRSLLMLICGSKEKYRQRRDLHTVRSHIARVFDACGMDMATMVPMNEQRPVALTYNDLLSLIEHLKACSDVATQRVAGWQLFCQQNNFVLLHLVQLSLRLVDGVVPLILMLLSCALTGKPTHAQEKPSKLSKAETPAGKVCPALIEQFFKSVDTELLTRFIRVLLLDANSTPVRWQIHSLLLCLHQNGSEDQQSMLCNTLWSLWPELPRYGRKGAQFVDLLGYFASCGQLSPEKAKLCSSMAVTLLRQQNKIMSQHPNGHIYHLLSDMVDFDGYYLESDPCLVCNNPEMPFTVMKLSAIRVDSKFTPTTQLVKLAGSYTIARFQLRITDSKRVKMVRVINLFYNNRSVQSVVELKNKRSLWHHVKQVHLQPGQNEVKIEFPLPVVACNLMIEFADFHVGTQVSPETLQCPRCSAQVPTTPGVCSNCGENVYQCHKCRSINYDEKDPFLCTSCGFCKYAKFDFIVHARTCCAVDPIENEDDRKKAVSSINGLLDRADRSYRQLVTQRNWLENQLGGASSAGGSADTDTKPSSREGTVRAQQLQRLVQQQQAQQQAQARQHLGAASAGSSSSSSGVNPNILSVAQHYCTECRTAFDELSIIIQKVLACRKELIEYDNAQQQLDGVDLASLDSSTGSQQHLPRSVSTLVMAGGSQGNCYGCASAAVDHCITLLRAVAQSSEVRPLLISEGLIGELMESNLHFGSQTTRHHVKQLLCLLTRNNCHATHLMNKVLCSRVITAIKSYRTMPNLAGSVRNEMDLLRMSVFMEDLCWEQRLRSVVKLFLASNCIDSAVVMDAISRPCSQILLHVVKAQESTPAKNPCATPGNLLHANALKWLKHDSSSTFRAWQRSRRIQGSPAEGEGPSTRERYLLVKYSQQWKIKAHKATLWKAQVNRDTWLMRTLFCSSSRSARNTAWHMIQALCTDDARRQHMLDLMMVSLGELAQAAQNGREFMMLFQELSSPLEWKLYLAVRGILPHLADLISKEIAKLQHLEETNLGSDLSQGAALKMLTEVLAQFLSHEKIKQCFKSRLVGAVLDGYLNLRRLIIQRTKMVDETQEMLLKLLEDMTSGTEKETKEFMAICVKALSKYPMNDLRTPVIIFERLCSIVYPEENEKTDFCLVLEKDPQQEEFLQGRMQGNPYSSADPGLGPLMRDVKNKVCRDCELVALLDDDASMELLVRNKIISLDLPVKDVYKKVWCESSDGSGNDKVMRVVYRMTGLLGDATEEIIKTLGAGSGDGNDDEELFRMASVLCECGGLEAMLARLEHLPNLIRGQQMIQALLKLFGYALKLKANCVHLIHPSKRAVPILLATLNQALSLKQEFCSKVAERVLSILETILLSASQAQTDMGELTAGTSEVGVLLGFIESSFVRSHTPVLHGMMKVIPYLTFGHAESMCELIDHFVPHLNFDMFDENQSAEDILYMDCFCGIVQGVQANEQGHRLKSLVLERSIVQHSIEHIQLHIPQYAASAGGTADKEWKAFLAKASLPYIMRLLAGLCKAHGPSQKLVCEIISELHHIEQTSSEGRVGSLAENVLEVLCENPEFQAKVKDCRDHTKAEKKRRAMAMRAKQLKELGMNVNQHGQVVASVSGVQQEMAALVEESGLKCVICHEGYKNQPKKILGVYTFSKRCQLDEGDGRGRKNLGYFTVSHFNVVHYECHMSAVRLARIRDEWESAALQNSNTKCNGLMPIWGPAVSEASFATCLARHNSNISEFTGVREPTFTFVLHDIRMLLLRFVTERSFSEESGGGGRQSNIHFMPFVLQIALYMLTTSRRFSHETTQLASFLSAEKSKWVSMCFGAESPCYFLVQALILHTPAVWEANRLKMLWHLILQAHARKDSSSPIQNVVSTEPHEYVVYKPMLCLFAMVDKCQALLKQNVDCSEDTEEFPTAWLAWMRHNDMAVLDCCDKVLNYLLDDLKDCESLDEFFDAAGLLGDVEKPTEYLDSLLKSLSAATAK